MWITFDCFGTLVDWHKGFSAVLQPFTGGRTEELLRAYHKFERLVEAERPHRAYKDVLTASLLRASAASGVALGESEAGALPREWGSLPVFEDVEPMLEELRGLGCHLGVLTNCDEDLFAQTQRCFRHPFDLVVTAERVRDYKPSASHFHYFWRSSGAELAGWIHVACSWFHDIMPARTFGLRTIWLDREATGEDASAATIRVRTAVEVGQAVRGLLGSSSSA
jgi:2-haloacid dehalogenase